MILLDTLPSLTQLHGLIAKVPRYPISAKSLVGLALRVGAGKEVVDFYRAFPDDEVFSSRDDLLERTDHVALLESQDAPEELLLSPEG